MVVVGVLLVVDGRVLAARRHEPPGWEFPGGKVEPGESPEDAVVRECQEELGVRVHVDLIVGSARDDRVDLRLYAARLAGGIPAALDHAELRWVRAPDLDALDWLPLDRALLPRVRAYLAAAGESR